MSSGYPATSSLIPASVPEIPDFPTLATALVTARETPAKAPASGLSFARISSSSVVFTGGISVR